MPGVSFDKRITNVDDEVGIPELVRYKTQRLIRYAKRVTIEAKNTTGKYAKVNGFKLTAVEDNDDYPKEDVEEICEAAMLAINDKFRERKAANDDLAEMDFRIVFDQRTDHGRERPAIELEHYSPDGPDMPIGFGAGGEDGSPMEVALEQMGGLVDKLMLRIDGLIIHIVDLSKDHKSMYQPLVQMMAIAHSNQVTGMEAQRRAMEYMYSTKRVEEEEAGRDRRAEKWMDWLKKPADQAVKQFGKYMRTRTGGKDDDDDDEEEEDDDDKEKAQSDPKKQTTKSGGVGPDKETIKNPVAQFAMALGQLLRPKQWAEAGALMTKKQLSLFSQLLESETDEKALKTYNKIDDGGIPLTKLIALKSILDKQQSDGLTKLIELINRVREEWADESAAEDDTGGGDEATDEAESDD